MKLSCFVFQKPDPGVYGDADNEHAEHKEEHLLLAHLSRVSIRGGARAFNRAGPLYAGRQVALSTLEVGAKMSPKQVCRTLRRPLDRRDSPYP